MAIGSVTSVWLRMNSFSGHCCSMHSQCKAPVTAHLQQVRQMLADRPFSLFIIGNCLWASLGQHSCEELQRLSNRGAHRANEASNTCHVSDVSDQRREELICVRCQGSETPVTPARFATLQTSCKCSAECRRQRHETPRSAKKHVVAYCFK